MSGFTLCWCRQQVTLSSNNHLTNRTFERKSPSTRIHMLPDQSNGGRILHTASLCSLPSVCICCVCGCVRVCLLQCVRPRSWVVHVCVQALCFFLLQYELETLSVCEYIASSPVFKFMYPTVELATLFSRVYFVFPCSIFVFCFSLTFIFDDDGNLTQSTGDRVLPELAPGRIRASVKKRGKELTIIFGSTCFSARQRQ